METITREQLELLPHHKQVRFALFCAKQVAHLSKDKRVIKAISTTEAFLEGKATKEECADAYASASYASAAAAANAAAYAAYAASYASADAYASAAYASAAAAANAASAAAAAAANAAAKSKLIEEQNNFYDQLLNADKYFEEIVLNNAI